MSDLVPLKDSLSGYFAKHATSIEKCYPRFTRPVAEKMMRTFLQSVPKTPRLAECSFPSVVAAFLQSAFLGLEVGGPAREACIVPINETVFKGTRNERKEMRAQMWPMVQGLMKLAWRNPRIATICSQVVHENDDFDLVLYPSTDMRHRVATKKPRGAIIGAYAYFETKTGQRSSPEWCDIETLNKVRMSSRAPNSPAWREWEDQMHRKTPLKRLCKGMPKFVETEGYALLDGALEADNDALNGTDKTELVFEAAGLSVPEDPIWALLDGPDTAAAENAAAQPEAGSQAAHEFLDGAVPPDRDRRG